MYLYSFKEGTEKEIFRLQGKLDKKFKDCYYEQSDLIIDYRDKTKIRLFDLRDLKQYYDNSTLSFNDYTVFLTYFKKKLK